MISSFTVIAHIAARLLEVVAMILAVPALFAVTRPLLSTVATVVLSLIHVTVLSSASDGLTVAVNCNVSPSESEAFDALSVIEVGFTYSFTDIVQVACVPLPSFALHVMVAVPTDLAMTNPLDATAATDASSDDQLTLWLFAELGLTVALSCMASPTCIEAEVLFNVMLVTYTVDDSTVTLQVAYFPLPSAARHVMVAVPADLADTSPLLIVATDVLLLDQFTFLFVAFVG